MSQANTVVVTIKTFVLKVNVDCKGCEKRVRKTLGKIDGVYTTTIDRENGTLTVSGNVDPPIIIRKLKKIGKHAELLPSEGEKNKPNSEAQGMQTVDGQDGNPQTDGKAKTGKRQPQVPQVGGMQELKLPLLNHVRLPSHVPVNLGHSEGDVGVDEINEMDIIDDDGPDEVVVLPNMNDMNQGQQQSSVAAAPINGSANGNQGGGNGGMSANKGDGRNNNPTNGDGGKKGGGKKGGIKNQAGAGGVAQNGGLQQATGDARNNNGAASDTGVVNNGAAGMVKGGGAQNAVAHGFNGMNLPGGALNVGNMKGNVPLPPMLNTHFPSMGNIPAAPGLMPTRPELNMGMQFQGLKPQVLTANPYHQQYPATLMMQPPPPPPLPYGMYPLKPAPYMPQAWHTGEPNVNYFSEENPNGCSIM